MKLLSDVADQPDLLLDNGFRRHEQDTADSVRWVRYTKTLQRDDSNVCSEVVVEFELFISDEAFASYTDDRSYTWNGCF